MAGVREDDDFVADINVTPFVDVMLVLLVIFMVTAPMMTEGLDVELPQVQAAEVLPTEDDHMILSIKTTGRCFWMNAPQPWTIWIAQTRRGAPGKQLFLRADKHVLRRRHGGHGTCPRRRHNQPRHDGGIAAQRGV
ncbi:MAG: biopolymer transporter ExbD [Bilophila wadsworthia]